MVDVPILGELAGHYMTGVAISFADRAASKNAKRHTEERIANKLGQTASLQYLVNAEQKPDVNELRQRQEYFDAITSAREYFEDKGITVRTEEKGLAKRFGRVSNFIKRYKGKEKLNNLRWDKKLATAFGIEFIADGIVAASQLMAGTGYGLTALGQSLVQAPALFAGLMTGKAVLYCKDKFRSKEEKKYDALAKELTVDGKLLEIVKAYSPTAELKAPEGAKQVESKDVSDNADKKGLSEKISDTITSTAGEITGGIKDGIGKVKDSITEIAEKKKAEKQAAEDAERAKKQKFEDELNKY